MPINILFGLYLSMPHALGIPSLRPWLPKLWPYSVDLHMSRSIYLAPAKPQQLIYSEGWNGIPLRIAGSEDAPVSSVPCTNKGWKHQSLTMWLSTPAKLVLAHMASRTDNSTITPRLTCRPSSSVPLKPGTSWTPWTDCSVPLARPSTPKTPGPLPVTWHGTITD